MAVDSTARVAAKSGVFVGTNVSVAVGSGVSVGTGVSVGNGVSVGTGVLVGAEVLVGASVGVACGAPPQPASIINTIIRTKARCMSAINGLLRDLVLITSSIGCYLV